jgi:hypothetical protein
LGRRTKVSIRKRPDGGYVIRYYADGTKNSPHRQETLGRIPFPDALRIYKERLAKAAARRGRMDDSRVTFGMLADECVNVHAAGKSEFAKVRAEQTLRIIRPIFRKRIVRDLKPLDIDRLRQMRLAGEVEIEGRKLTPAREL